jgi:hypothetical protein
MEVTMGYFANGTEGMDYELSVCVKCVHNENEDKGCPVWLTHLLYAYEECNNVGKTNAANMLDILIPRGDGGNGRCTMFVPLSRLKSKRDVKLEERLDEVKAGKW